MLVDMHIHESTCSSDSKMTLKEIVATAKERGLDAVCITDHDSMGLKEFAEAYSEEIGFPIFVGVEYFSLWGDSHPAIPFYLTPDNEKKLFP